MYSKRDYLLSCWQPRSRMSHASGWHNSFAASFLSFNVTQWVFTTVSLANLLWFFLLGSGPVGCLLCCLSNGETQIWLGDLRLALFLLVCVLFVLAVMICQASCDHRRPCRSFLTNSFVSCKDRASERDRPYRREKNHRHSGPAGLLGFLFGFPTLPLRSVYSSGFRCVCFHMSA